MHHFEESSTSVVTIGMPGRFARIAWLHRRTSSQLHLIRLRVIERSYVLRSRNVLQDGK